MRVSLSLVVLATSVACGSTSAPPTTGPNPVDSANVVAVPSTAPTTTASTAPPEAAPSFARVAVDAPAVLARLPKDAAVYGWIRPVAIDNVIAWSQSARDARTLMTKALGADTVLAVLRDVGVEPGAPVAFAVVGGDVAAAQKHLNTMTTSKDPLAQGDKSPVAAYHFRFVGQSVAGTDVGARGAELVQRLRYKHVPCAGSAACAAFGKSAPSFLAVGPDGVAAVTVEGARVEVDFVVIDGMPETRVAELAKARQRAVGGPKDRCSTLDIEADLTFCVDPERTGQLGAAAGMAVTASVLGMVDPPQRKKIAAAGKAESMRNIELSKPSAVLLDDGTVSIVADKKDLRVTASWKTTPASAAKVEARLAEEKCFKGAGALRMAAPILVETFPDPGKGFGKDRLTHVHEGGGAALFVLLGRTWPNFVTLGLVDQLPDVPLKNAEICLANASGRLRARAHAPDVALP